jgi:hypothetical protein
MGSCGSGKRIGVIGVQRRAGETRVTLEELAAAAEAAQEKAWAANNVAWAAWQSAQNLADAARALVNQKCPTK